MRLFAVVLALLTPFSASALPILADISSHRVEIHSAFTGTQLLVMTPEMLSLLFAVHNKTSFCVKKSAWRVSGLIASSIA